MYAVSNAYVASMASDLREMPSFAVVLYNADVEANAMLSFTYTPEPLQYGKGLNSFNQMPSAVPRATLERNWLRANEQYSSQDTGHYIGAGLSSAEANADGLYEYDQPDVMTVSTIGSSKPISFIVDPSVAAVEVTRTDGSVERVILNGGEQKQVLAIHDDGIGELSIKFLASFYPCRRPRVYGVYAADVFDWDCDDIVEAELEDENDLLCLELPGRTVKLLISNLDGKLDPYNESINPTFHRKDTQALLTFLYEGESVPVGRLFLDTYTVDKEQIAFSFGWAVLPLEDSVHSLSCFGDYTPLERIYEVVDPDPEFVITVLRGAEENTARKYAVNIDTSGVSGDSLIIQNPYPIGSRASCLQLLCNAANIVMRPGRSKDIAFLSQDRLYTERRIGYEELLEDPTYTNEEEVRGADIVCYDHQAAINTDMDGVMAYTGSKTRIELSEPSDAAAGIVQNILDENGAEIGCITFAAQGYVAYVWCEMYDSSREWSQNSGPFHLPIRKGQKATVTYGSSPKRKIDNPLVSSSVRASLAPHIISTLARNAVVTIEHRGFPELDCGDVIEVQLESGGEFVPAFVVQNRWKFKSGVLSGTTKIRLPKGVG